MKIDLVTEEHFNRFKAEMIAAMTDLIQNERQPRQWLKGAEVKELLQISTTKLTDLRVNGALTFTLYGNMYYYDINSVYEQMEKNKVKCRECA
jgi:hypothetical protein